MKSQITSLQRDIDLIREKVMMDRSASNASLERDLYSQHHYSKGPLSQISQNITAYPQKFSTETKTSTMNTLGDTFQYLNN